MEFPYIQDKIIEEMKIASALRDRKIYFSEEVDRDSIFKAIYYLDRIMSIDEQENKPINERKPIEILISSFGGEIYQGLALISKIEALKSMGYHIITTVQSVAMSMGAMILIVGSERRAYKYSRILIHQPSSGMWFQELEKMQRDVEETLYLWNLTKNIIIKNTKIPNDRLEQIKLTCKDWYFSSEEALEMGLIDVII